jgi:hypothetical protein
VQDVCEFDEAGHVYTRNGVALPSITRIIDYCIPRSDNAPEDAIEIARLRGTWVDEHFAEYLMLGNVEADPREFDSIKLYDEYTHCLELAVEWWNKNRYRSRVRTQVRLFGEREAGTADLIVDDHEIIDLKSTYVIDARKVSCQLGGYGDLVMEQAMLESEVTGVVPYDLGILHVVKRLKNAQYRPISGITAHLDWRTIRNYWRFLHEKRV